MQNLYTIQNKTFLLDIEGLKACQNEPLTLFCIWQVCMLRKVDFVIEDLDLH